MSAIKLHDHYEIVKKFDILVNDAAFGFTSYPYDGGDEARRLNYAGPDKKKKKTVIVTSGDTALEIGSVRHQSLASIFWTSLGDVLDDRVYIAGRDFSNAYSNNESPLSFMAAVLLGVSESVNPGGLYLQKALKLSNMLPGFMSRSIPGKYWVRISRDLLSRGFSTLSMAQVMIKAFRDIEPDLTWVRIIIAAGDDTVIDYVKPFFTLGRVLNGKNRKLVLEGDGLLSCEDLNCESCEEKQNCDVIRDIIILRNKLKKQVPQR